MYHALYNPTRRACLSSCSNRLPSNSSRLMSGRPLSSTPRGGWDASDGSGRRQNPQPPDYFHQTSESMHIDWLLWSRHLRQRPLYRLRYHLIPGKVRMRAPRVITAQHDLKPTLTLPLRPAASPARPRSILQWVKCYNRSERQARAICFIQSSAQAWTTANFVKSVERPRGAKGAHSAEERGKVKTKLA